MKILAVIILAFFHVQSFCARTENGKDLETAEYNMNKAIEKLQECDRIIGQCVQDMIESREYSERREDLEIVYKLFSRNIKEMAQRLKRKRLKHKKNELRNDRKTENDAPHSNGSTSKDNRDGRDETERNPTRSNDKGPNTEKNSKLERREPSRDKSDLGSPGKEPNHKAPASQKIDK